MICDTAQRGEAATKGARVCDPQELCRPPSVLTNPARRWLSTCCGSQSRAPQIRRGLRRFGQILIEKLQVLTSMAIGRRRFRDLVLDVSRELGAWDLELRPDFTSWARLSFQVVRALS